MRPLIVGIDPGNTLAVAAIDFDGEIQLLESKRHFETAEVTEKILETGKPIIIAGDKKSTPSKIDSLASSMGAEVYEPEKDLSQKKKTELGKGDNSHEIDASAAAFNAYNNLDRELKKVEKIRKENQISRLKAAEKYFLNQKITSKQPSEKEDEQEQRQKEPRPRNEEKEVSRLERRVKRLESQIKGLKQEKSVLEADTDRLEEKLVCEKEKDRSKVLHSEELKKREAIIKEKNNEIKQLKDKNTKLSKLLKQYRKALKALDDGARLLPIVESDNQEYDLAVSRREKDLENAFHVEEIKGIELKDFFVAEDVPKKDLGQILKEYKRKRGQ